MTQEVQRVTIPAPLTLADIRPAPWTFSLAGCVETTIYSNGTRLDNGWEYGHGGGIYRKVPGCIPKKRRGKNIRSMIVLCDADRNTINTIIAHYSFTDAVEYVLETAYNPAAHCYPPKIPAMAYVM